VSELSSVSTNYTFLYAIFINGALPLSDTAWSKGQSQLNEQSGKRESVWDYPRPPRLEPSVRHLQVFHAGLLIGETKRSLRILETSHPPVYYLPPEDVCMDLLRRSKRQGTVCEFKGLATYWTLDLSRGGATPANAGGATVVLDAAWSYENPPIGYAGLRGYLAFYASRVDACYVDGERVAAQAGDFYGGWITADIEGPFKGGAGTLGW
jgi:uncharacterized protein (DUF427 family)